MFVNNFDEKIEVLLEESQFLRKGVGEYIGNESKGRGESEMW